MLAGEIDGKRFLRAMGRLGWRVKKTSASHRILAHAESSRILIVAFHKTISRNSVRRALREAGITDEAFEREL